MSRGMGTPPWQDAFRDFPQSIRVEIQVALRSALVWTTSGNWTWLWHFTRSENAGWSCPVVTAFANADVEAMVIVIVTSTATHVRHRPNDSHVAKPSRRTVIRTPSLSNRMVGTRRYGTQATCSLPKVVQLNANATRLQWSPTRQWCAQSIWINIP